MKSPKVAIVCLIVVALAVVGVLVLGTRQGGGSARDRPGVVELFGRLRDRTRPPVRAADVTGAPCAGAARGDLALAAGRVCSVPLPEGAGSVTVCSPGGGQLTLLAVQGRDYPRQDADRGRLACSAGSSRFDLYDEASSLLLACAPVGAACALRVVDPR